MPYLVFNLNNGNQFCFDLVEERLTLGRSPQNDIVIDNKIISTVHAELLRQPDGKYKVVDLKSANGTYVNGTRTESAVLKPNDKINFSHVSAYYRSGIGPTPRPSEKSGVIPQGNVITGVDEIERKDGPLPATATTTVSPPAGHQTQGVDLPIAAGEQTDDWKGGKTTDQPNQDVPPSDNPVARKIIEVRIKPGKLGSTETSSPAATPKESEEEAGRQSLTMLRAQQTQAANSLQETLTACATKKSELAEYAAKSEAARGDLETVTRQRAVAEIKSKEVLESTQAADARLKELLEAAASAQSELQTLKAQQTAARLQLRTAQDESEKFALEFTARKQALDSTLSSREEGLISLKRQATEAEAARVAAEQQVQELATTTQRLSEARNELDRLLEQQAAVKATLAQLSTKQEKGREQTEATDKLGSIQQEYADMVSKTKVLIDERQGHERDLAAAKMRAEEFARVVALRQAEREKEHAASIAAIDATIAAKEQAAAAATTKLKNLEDRCATIAQELATVETSQQHLHTLKQEIATQESRRTALAALISKDTASHLQAEAALTHLSLEITSREDTLKTLAARESDLMEKIKSRYQDKQSQDLRIEQLRSVAADLESDLAAQRGDLDRTISVKKEEAQRLEKSVADLRQDEAGLKRKLEDLAAADRQLKASTRELQTMDGQRVQAEAILTALAQDRDAKETEASRLAEKLAQQRALVQTLTDQRSGLEEDIKQLHGSVEAAKIQLEELRASMVRTEQSAALEASRSGLEKNLADLKQSEKKLAESRSWLSITLQQQTKLDGKIREIAERVQAEQARLEGIESAIREKNAHLESLTMKQTSMESDLAKLAKDEPAPTKG